jgi:hypothetical protein
MRAAASFGMAAGAALLAAALSCMPPWLAAAAQEGYSPAHRPQTPRPPYPYREEQVVYRNEASGLQLAGTLTLPEGEGPFAAAVLITGSGQQDRDETVMGHKPFWVLADHLTRKGIAVLRSDDRGVGGSEAGDLEQVTTADFATDVQAAMAFLKTRSDIDAARIGLIGHSEGGAIAPMVAAGGGAVAWMVLLAAPGVPGEDLLQAQSRLVGAAMGYSPEELDKTAALNKQVYEVVKAEADAARRRERIRPLIAAALEPVGVPPATIDMQVRAVSGKWFRFFLAFDPASVLREVSCPVLALNGGLDMQVPPDQNLPALRAALAHNKQAQVRELPGLNHLFQTTTDGSPAEYQSIRETFSPAVLDVISGWILGPAAWSPGIALTQAAPPTAATRPPTSARPRRGRRRPSPPTGHCAQPPCAAADCRRSKPGRRACPA